MCRRKPAAVIDPFHSRAAKKIAYARTRSPALPIIDQLHADLPPCAGCGRCCHLVVELRTTDSVAETFVAVHAGARCMAQHGDGACVALDRVTQLCTIYATRPQTCRDFNRGGALCRRTLAGLRSV